MNFIWSRRSATDLENIREYISRDSKEAAKKVVLAIVTFVEKQLSEFPQCGRPGRVSDTLELVIPKLPYVVPYRIKRNQIEIIRVYHQQRLWPDRL